MAKKIKWAGPLATSFGWNRPLTLAIPPTILGREPNHAWQAEDKARLDEVAREAAIRREGLQKICELLVEYVPDALESSSLDQKEKELLRKNQAELKDVLRLLDSLLEGISSPVRRNDICYMMTEAIWSANVLGRYSPPVPAISRMEKKIQTEIKTKHMRDKKASKNKPKEIALLNAIAKHTTILSITRTSKEAAAILVDVNRELAEQGYPPVKVDVVRHRLENFRVLKERTKS